MRNWLYTALITITLATGTDLAIAGEVQALEAISWQSVIVALGILAMLSVASVIAIQKYNTADEALKMVGAFLGLFGVVIGSFGTYFFTRPPLKEAQRLAAVYQERAANAEQQLASLGKNTTSLLTELSKQGGQTPLATVKADPKIATSLKNIELNIESLKSWTIGGVPREDTGG